MPESKKIIADDANFSFKRFSGQAHLCAAISGAFGRIVDYPAREDVFTAAPLHSVGKMVIAVYFPKNLGAIIDLKKRGDFHRRRRKAGARRRPCRNRGGDPGAVWASSRQLQGGAASRGHLTAR